MNKTYTDIFWNQRALDEKDVSSVNIADTAQRKLETEFILSHLTKTDNILEVGCGNGFLTNTLRNHVNHVDAFDYSENMVKQAIEHFGETNNSFSCKNLLEPIDTDKKFDAVVCIRVLINLSNLEEQFQALEHIKKVLKPGSRLILIEGYKDGFTAINALRQKSGLAELSPAKINFYSNYNDIYNFLIGDFDIKAEFHSGCFDFLTRVVYPSLVGAENAQGYGEFHDKILNVAKNYNLPEMKALARLRGFCLIKK